MAGARTWILDQLDAERSRWMLWLPVAMGLGIALYFELPSEPAPWLGPALAAGGQVLVEIDGRTWWAPPAPHRRPLYACAESEEWEIVGGLVSSQP